MTEEVPGEGSIPGPEVPTVFVCIMGQVRLNLPEPRFSSLQNGDSDISSFHFTGFLFPVRRR